MKVRLVKKDSSLNLNDPVVMEDLLKQVIDIWLYIKIDVLYDLADYLICKLLNADFHRTPSNNKTAIVKLRQIWPKGVCCVIFWKSKSFCISAQTEDERQRSDCRHQTELEAAVGWKSFPQGREEDEEEEERWALVSTFMEGVFPFSFKWSMFCQKTRGGRSTHIFYLSESTNTTV